MPTLSVWTIAVSGAARAGAPLKRVLERAGEDDEWASRLVNVSHYPLPAFMPLCST